MAFIETLEGLGQFEESAIVVHADHGKENLEDIRLSIWPGMPRCSSSRRGEAPTFLFETSPPSHASSCTSHNLGGSGPGTLPVFDGLSFSIPGCFPRDRSAIRHLR